MKNQGLIDFRGVAGKLLRGNKVYGAHGGTSPNPTGRNQYQAVAKLKLRKMKKEARRRAN